MRSQWSCGGVYQQRLVGQRKTCSGTRVHHQKQENSEWPSIGRECASLSLKNTRCTQVYSALKSSLFLHQALAIKAKIAEMCESGFKRVRASMKRHGTQDAAALAASGVATSSVRTPALHPWFATATILIYPHGCDPPIGTHQSRFNQGKRNRRRCFTRRGGRRL